jgi:hypothetical protein
MDTRKLGNTRCFRYRGFRRPIDEVFVVVDSEVVPDFEKRVHSWIHFIHS